MQKIAIDCVLLPSEQMLDRAIEANKKLSGEGNRRILLNKDNCLPHISLAMGCVHKSDIHVLEAMLNDIAKIFSFDTLKATNICIQTDSMGQKVSSFQIEKTKELQLLHETVLKKFKPYITYDVTEDMLFGTNVSRLTLQWIKNYRQESSFRNFFPHITIGFGRLDNSDFPIEFTASKLALCHLGDNCTCRKILVSTQI